MNIVQNYYFLLHKMSTHLFVLLLLVLKHTYSFSILARTVGSQNNRNPDIDLVNTFSDCIITLINFRGVDINFSILNTPIVLLRYFSFKKGWFLFPDELRPPHSHNFNEYISESTVSRKKNRIIISRKNQTIKLSIRTSLKYMHFIQSWNFRTSLKRTTCEVNIYLHPGNIYTDPYIYFKHEYFGIMIKDPFWIDYEEKWEVQSWRLEFINSIPKYSLLICHEDDRLSSCYDDNHKKNGFQLCLGIPILCACMNFD